MNTWDAICFHANAMGSSIAESVGDAANGVVQLVTEDAPAATTDYYYSVSKDYGSFLAGVSAPFAYLAHITVIPTGEAIGTGAAMVVYADNGEDVAMGATSLFAGLCSAFGMAVGAIAPRPTITVPSFGYSVSGEGALAMSVATVEVPAPAIGGAVSAAFANGSAGAKKPPKKSARDTGKGKKASKKSAVDEKNDPMLKLHKITKEEFQKAAHPPREIEYVRIGRSLIGFFRLFGQRLY